MDQEHAAETEAQGGGVLGQVVAALGDKAAVVIDEAQEDGVPGRAVLSGADLRAVMEIGDHQFEGSIGPDPAEGLLARVPRRRRERSWRSRWRSRVSGLRPPTATSSSRSMMSMMVVGIVGVS